MFSYIYIYIYIYYLAGHGYIFWERAGHRYRVVYIEKKSAISYYKPCLMALTLDITCFHKLFDWSNQWYNTNVDVLWLSYKWIVKGN